MRSCKLRGRMALAIMTSLVALATQPAGAQNLDLDEMAAALALPIITGAQDGNPIKGSTGDVVIFNQSAVTLATVTNGRSTPVRLKIDLISGDKDYHGGDTWQSTSLECDLTGRETTTLVFTPNYIVTDQTTEWDRDGDGRSRLYVECSDLSDDDTDGKPRALFTNVQNGVMFIAAADPTTGASLSEDVLFGDAVVVDFLLGQAYSVEAIAFQAGSGANNGDKVYRFDNLEYAKFPAVLAANFIAPVDENIEAELILITLDGTTGNIPVPRARLGGLGYNDDEEFFDYQWEFDCFDIVSLRDIDPNFEFQPNSPLGLGSMSGHIQLVPQPVATANDSHDAEYGDGNNVRKRPVHGWLVQNVRGADHPLAKRGTYRDEFTYAVYTNQDGTLLWSNAWDESFDDDVPTTGKILITGGRLRIMGPTPSGMDPRIDREFDATGYDVGTLRFDIFGPAVNDVGDVVSVSISADGGATFTQLMTFAGPGPTTQNVEIDITPFLAQNSRLQFRVETNTDGNMGTENYEIDNVEVEVSRAGRIVQKDEPIHGTPEIAVLGTAAWARPLDQSTTALAPFLGDQNPVLDADPIN